MSEPMSHEPSERAKAAALQAYERFGVALSDSSLFHKIEEMLEAAYAIDHPSGGPELDRAVLRHAIGSALFFEYPSNSPKLQALMDQHVDPAVDNIIDYLRGLSAGTAGEPTTAMDDPAIRERYEEARKRWEEIGRPIAESVRESETLSEQDFSARIGRGTSEGTPGEGT